MTFWSCQFDLLHNCGPTCDLVKYSNLQIIYNTGGLVNCVLGVVVAYDNWCKVDNGGYNIMPLCCGWTTADHLGYRYQATPHPSVCLLTTDPYPSYSH